MSQQPGMPSTGRTLLTMPTMKSPRQMAVMGTSTRTGSTKHSSLSQGGHGLALLLFPLPPHVLPGDAAASAPSATGQDSQRHSCSFGLVPPHSWGLQGGSTTPATPLPHGPTTSGATLKGEEHRQSSPPARQQHRHCCWGETKWFGGSATCQQD